MKRVAARRGATKLEYALTIMLVGVSCALLVGTLGHSVGRLYNVRDEPAAAVPAAATDGPPGERAAGGERDPDNGNDGNDKRGGDAR